MKKTVIVVAAIIKNDKNEYLCTLRPEGKHLANLWEFPGGKLHDGETPQQGIVREIREELDILIEPSLEIFSNTSFEYEKNIINLICIEAKIISGEIKLLEHKELKWLGREELSSLSWAPADIEVVNKITG